MMYREKLYCYCHDKVRLVEVNAILQQVLNRPLSFIVTWDIYLRHNTCSGSGFKYILQPSWSTVVFMWTSLWLVQPLTYQTYVPKIIRQSHIRILHYTQRWGSQNDRPSTVAQELSTCLQIQRCWVRFSIRTIFFASHLWLVWKSSQLATKHG